MRKQIFYGLVFLLLPLAIAKADDTTKVKSQIAQYIISGKDVVVLFMTPEDSEKLAAQKNQDEIELYADWEYYLNEFLSKNAKKVAVIQVSVREGRKLLGSKTRPHSQVSTLFVKKGNKALYAKEALLGPTEYKYVEAYFEGKENTIKYSQLTSVEPDLVKEIDPKDIPRELGFEYIDSPVR